MVRRNPDKILASGKWAFGLGVVACGIACTAPLFVGLLGVGAATTAALQGGLESAAIVLSLCGLAIIGARLLKRRLKSRRVGPAVDPCGCEASSVVSPEVETPSNAGRPIVCTLDAEGARRWISDFRQVLRRAFVEGERLSDRVRWRFRSVPGLQNDLGALAERARSCCAFFELRVSDDQTEVWWACRPDAAAEPVMDELVKLPGRLVDRDNWPEERLLGAVSAAFRKAGGRFAADAH